MDIFESPIYKSLYASFKKFKIWEKTAGDTARHMASFCHSLEDLKKFQAAINDSVAQLEKEGKETIV